MSVLNYFYFESMEKYKEVYSRMLLASENTNIKGLSKFLKLAPKDIAMVKSFKVIPKKWLVTILFTTQVHPA